MMKKYVALATLLPALGLFATDIARADQGATLDQAAAETQAFRSAKLSPLQALQAAESHMNGKATGVSFEGPLAAPYYKVELLAADGSMQDIAVDAMSGEVMKIADSKLDYGDNADRGGTDEQEGDDHGADGENPEQ